MSKKSERFDYKEPLQPVAKTTHVNLMRNGVLTVVEAVPSSSVTVLEAEHLNAQGLSVIGDGDTRKVLIV